MQQGSMKGSGWAAVHHFSFSPDSWVQKTDSLSLSTKLINSLLERPDKPLINWLHWPPSRSAAGGQSPSGPHPRARSAPAQVPSQPGTLSGAPGPFAPQEGWAIPIPMAPPCPFLLVPPPLGGVVWSEQIPAPSSPSSASLRSLPYSAPCAGEGVPRGR